MIMIPTEKHGTMAKKQTNPPPTRRKIKPADVKRISIINLKSTPEYKAWIDGMVEHAVAGRHALNMTDAIDRAIVSFAEKIGYEVKPPLR